MGTVLQGLSPLESYRELTDFARRCGENALRLAMHAAVPQSFRPELLHLLKLNFLPETVRDLAVEADVLLAPFTENLSGGYYQFDPETRRQLLDRLDAAHPQHNGSRLQQVARFLAGYVNREEEKLEGSADPLRRDFLEIQRWVALAYIDHDSAARQLAYALDHSSENDRGAVRLQIGGLIRSLSAPLAAHPELLIYAAGLRSLEEGRFQEGRQLLERLGSAEVQVAGLKLRPVEAVITEWRSRLKAPVEETDRPTGSESILIFTDPGPSSWSTEPLFQHWIDTGFRIEFLSLSDAPIDGQKEARKFVSEHRVAFLVLDELTPSSAQGLVSAILGLPSLPVIPVWRPRPGDPGTREQYLSNRLNFGWWANLIEMDGNTDVNVLAEQVQTAVAKIIAWAQAPENALELTRQQAAFSWQYGGGPDDELRALVEVQVQNSRSQAHELLERKDLAGARSLLEQALAAHKEIQRAETQRKAELLAELGEILIAQGEFESAVPLLQEALDGARRFNSKHLEVFVLSNMGEVLLNLYDGAEGKVFLEQALALSEEIADPQTVKIRKLLAEWFPEPATKVSRAADSPDNDKPARTGHDVFISYAPPDKAVGLAIDDYLEQRGIRCWITPRNIQFGAKRAESVAAAIAQCRVVVVVTSQFGNQSTQIAQELELATNARKIVIPFRIDSGKLSSEIAFSNSIDATGEWQNSLPALATRILELLPRDSPLPQTALAFVSYAREDSDFTLRLVKDLKASGLKVWLDQLDMLPGARWDAEIENALKTSSVLLVILSPASVISNNVMDEVSFALEEKKTIIPLMYRDCQIPFRLRPRQYLDFRTDYQQALQLLSRQLAQSEPESPSASSPSVVPQIACKVFINHRREDSSAWAARLYEDLRARVAPGGEILLDDSPEPRIDSLQALERTIGACRVMLVLIGPQWLPSLQAHGQTEGSNITDVVIAEIRIAFEQNLSVIPVLVDGVDAPSPYHVPPAISSLAFRREVSLSDKSWQTDVDLLVQRIASASVTLAEPPPAN